MFSSLEHEHEKESFGMCLQILIYTEGQLLVLAGSIGHCNKLNFLKYKQLIST